MKIRLQPFSVTKRYPLTISRGTTAHTDNLIVIVEEDGMTGIGEMAPTSGGKVPETAETAQADLEQWIPLLERFSPWEFQKIEAVLDAVEGGRAARAGLDLALHDWIGKRWNIPVWRMLGFNLDSIPQTSITIGINPPEIIRERMPEILERTGAAYLKVKLGSPAGEEADREIFAVAQEAVTRPVKWRVDANGGWDIPTARRMMAWLAERGVEFVEQPLARGREEELPAVYESAPLPLYVDESVAVAADIPPLADCVDGVNLKLMKCGGLREGLRFMHTAKALGLKLMMGCMSESSLSITGAAHLSPLADSLDLDSHLNLLPDPFHGAALAEGRILPNDEPGLGVKPIPSVLSLSL